MNRTLLRRVTQLLVVALIAVASWHIVLRPEPQLRISAEFPSAEGIFAGSSVSLLGVPTGQVEQVHPQGSTVRVTMSFPEDTRIPREAHAYIMNPAVVSDRFVELSPIHPTGPVLDNEDVIPVERAHAPVKWNELTRSLDELLDVLGSADREEGSDLGALMSTAADFLDGNGQQLHEAITGITQASDVLAGNTDDLESVLDNVDRLLEFLTEHQSIVDKLTATASTVATDFTEQQEAVTRSIDELSRVLGAFSALLDEHGDELTEDVSQLTDLTTNVVAHQQDLTESLDTLPLALENFDRAVTEDDRLRIRLDISSTLSQFAPTAELCDRLPVPLCSGAGLTNPIDFPPELPDALGIEEALAGDGE